MLKKIAYAALFALSFGFATASLSAPAAADEAPEEMHDVCSRGMC